MEPISQAVLGIMGQGLRTKSSKLTSIKRAIFGALGGMAPDLDYVIRASNDPLFTIEYHRQFTHSLFFIPFGSFVVSLFLKIFKINIKDSYPYVFLGFATHGLLDAFTNYGTQLWWPFSNKREAWNCVAVVDPLITLPLIVLMYLFVRHRNTVFNYCAWGLLLFYLGLGRFQQYRVENFLKNLNVINQETIRYMIKPTIGNNFIWRVILEDKEFLTFYGVRLGLFSDNILRQGDTVSKVQNEQVEQLLKNNPIQLNDYERFKYFTDNYLFWYKDNEISDGRYSMVAHSKEPIWIIRLKPEKLEHVDYEVKNRVDDTTKVELKKYFLGN